MTNRMAGSRAHAARPIVGAEAEALVRTIEALYEGEGLPARKVLTIDAPDGSGPRIRLGRLFIECVVCGMRQPQSKTRKSPEARRLWIEMHLRCPE